MQVSDLDKIPEAMLKRVLLVEDDANIRRMLDTMLIKRGYDVDAFDNGENAWQCYQQKHHPLVILDWMLPGISGIDLCRRIRKHPEAEYCTIIIETARTAQQDLMQALDAGADDYLPKPLSMQMFQVRLAIAERAVREKIGRKLAEEKLEESEEVYRLLVQALPDMVYKLDENGIFTFVSNASDQFGYSPEDLLGKHFAELVSEEDADRISRNLVLPRYEGRETGDDDAPKLFDEKRGRKRKTAHLEVRIRPSDAKRSDSTRQRPLLGEVNACGIYAEEGAKAKGFLGTSGIIRDITKRKEMQEALILSERMAAVGTLAGGVAHEFNNLHAIIKGYLEMAIAARDIPPKVKGWLKIALESTLHGADVTHNLLALCGRSTGRKRRVNISDIVTSTLKIVRNEFATEGIKIDLQIQEPPPAVADRTQIGQVIMNFLINARHAMKESDTKHITVSCGVEDSRIFIRASDTGCGIPPEIINRIFDPFFTTKGERAEGTLTQNDLKGVGLGLSICSTIAREHGGEITVQSKLGQGTAFTLWLPIPEPGSGNDEGGPNRDPQPRKQVDFSAHQGKRILVLDDEQHIRELLTSVLEAKGFTVTATDDGRAALQMHREQPFDLILVDLQMPKISGEEFLTELQCQKPAKKSTSVVMTGKLIGDIPEGRSDLTIFSAVPKPFNMQELLHAIHGALEN